MKLLTLMNNRFMSKLIAGYASLDSFVAVSASTLEEANSLLEQDEAPEIMIIDLSYATSEKLAWIKSVSEQRSSHWRPILGILDDSNPTAVRQAYAAGIDDHVAKPAKEFVLRSKLESLRVRLNTFKQLRDNNENLRQQAATDPLTGLMNRRGFFDAALRLENQCYRSKQPVSALMIDIDQFKAYNDTLGHAEGDICLTMVANTIKNSLRRPLDIVGRIGGEEFAVLLPETGEKGAKIVAEQIRRSIELSAVPHPAKFGQMMPYVTISIGTASRDHDALSGIENILREADAGLYIAKQNGRNRTCSAQSPSLAHKQENPTTNSGKLPPSLYIIAS